MAAGRLWWATVPLFLVLALLLAACAGGQTQAPQPSGDDGSGSVAPAQDEPAKTATPGSAAKNLPKVLRFVFAPDPVWDYMQDQGIVEEYEKQYNVRVNQIVSWDEFSFFAGGHADVTSIATYELPVYEQETGQKLVTFGGYNKLRITPIVRADSPAKTLADLKGGKIGVPSAVASTLLWGALVKDMHNLDFRVNGGDFQLFIQSHQVMPELVMKGELDACLCIPEMAVSQLRKGEMRVLYDEKSAWEIFRDQYDPDKTHEGAMGNVFVANAEWFDQNPDVAAFFLALWERGIQEWQQNSADIIRTYPEHFSVEAPEDVEFMIDYIRRHDWFVKTVYLDPVWIEKESKIFDLMKKTSFMDQSAPTPRLEAVPRS